MNLYLTYELLSNLRALIYEVCPPSDKSSMLGDNQSSVMSWEQSREFQRMLATLILVLEYTTRDCLPGNNKYELAKMIRPEHVFVNIHSDLQFHYNDFMIASYYNNESSRISFNVQLRYRISFDVQLRYRLYLSQGALFR
jgi:hypothetical protein